MISTRSAGLVIDTVVCLTLAKWETVSGRFGGYLTRSLEPLRLVEVQFIPNLQFLFVEVRRRRITAWAATISRGTSFWGLVFDGRRNCRHSARPAQRLDPYV